MSSAVVHSAKPNNIQAVLGSVAKMVVPLDAADAAVLACGLGQVSRLDGLLHSLMSRYLVGVTSLIGRHCALRHLGMRRAISSVGGFAPLRLLIRRVVFSAYPLTLPLLFPKEGICQPVGMPSLRTTGLTAGHAPRQPIRPRREGIRRLYFATLSTRASGPVRGEQLCRPDGVPNRVGQDEASCATTGAELTESPIDLIRNGEECYAAKTTGTRYCAPISRLDTIRLHRDLPLTWNRGACPRLLKQVRGRFVARIIP